MAEKEAAGPEAEAAWRAAAEGPARAGMAAALGEAKWVATVEGATATVAEATVEGGRAV